MTFVKGKILTNAEKVARHYIKHPQVYNDYRKRKKKAVFAILGDVCVKCGFSDERALQIDHIIGNESNE